jgi:molybdenum cofactor guanylyltransferase
MVVGAVLAGGEGRRMREALGGAPSKPTVLLGGRPLVAYPLGVLAEVCDRVAVVCKPGTELPDLGEAERWEEPAEPSHPLAGIVHALERAGGPVLVCAADMPHVTPAACRELLAEASLGVGPGAAESESTRAPSATVASAGGRLEPLLGVYLPAALPALRAAPADAPLRAAVAELEPRRVALPTALVRSVNTPDDLAAAGAALAARGPATG